MEKQKADWMITEYTKKLFGFALARTNSITEAEELASRITLEVYTSLLRRDEINNVDGYIYKIAQNVYSRYIESGKRERFLSFDEAIAADNCVLNGQNEFIEIIAESESYQLLRREIAYLSKLQREIVVAHYFDGLKLSEIAEKMNLPLGSVK